MNTYSESEIEQLIIGKLAGELSDSEERKLHFWLEEDPRHMADFRTYEKLYLDAKALRLDFNPDIEQALQKVKIKAVTRHFRLRNLWKYAAVIFFMLGIGGYFLFLQEKPEMFSQDLIIPGSQKAILYLSSGEVVSLENVTAGSRVLQSIQADVVVDSNHTLRYSAVVPDGKVAGQKHTLSVPVGGEYRMVLEDGTKVWLNAASKLIYPEIFNDKIREVELVGEAFFEVMPDLNRPFVVKTNILNVKVLGTSFNVKAYEEEQVTSATLVKGKVEISSSILPETFILKPGEQALGDRLKMEKRCVNLQPYISWIDGKFVFSNTCLEELCRQISRWYDVNVIFQEDECKNIRFTGAMVKFRPLGDLLDMIEATSQVKFQIQEKNILVFQK